MREITAIYRIEVVAVHLARGTEEVVGKTLSVLKGLFPITSSGPVCS